MVSTKRTLAVEIFMKNCHTEIHKNSADGLVLDIMWTDGLTAWCGRHVIIAVLNGT
jgi:hypothetical protein